MGRVTECQLYMLQNFDNYNFQCEKSVGTSLQHERSLQHDVSFKRENTLDVLTSFFSFRPTLVRV